GKSASRKSGGTVDVQATSAPTSYAASLDSFGGGRAKCHGGGGCVRVVIPRPRAFRTQAGHAYAPNPAVSSLSTATSRAPSVRPAYTASVTRGFAWRASI